MNMPAVMRIVKQVSYAGIAAAVLAAVVFLIVLPRLDLWSHDEPAVNNTVSIVVESAEVVSRGDAVDVVARIRNPNPSLGVSDYPVTFVLLDKEGQEVRKVSEKTYLLPGSLNYVAMIDVPTTPSVEKVRVDLSDEPVYRNLPVGVSMPSFNSFLRDRRMVTIGGGEQEVQKGVVTNTGTLGFRVVEITGVAFDVNDKVVGVGKTFIGELGAGEQREFTLQWPIPASATRKVIVIPSTNIYQEDNILRVAGDPSKLR